LIQQHSVFMKRRQLSVTHHSCCIVRAHLPGHDWMSQLQEHIQDLSWNEQVSEQSWIVSSSYWTHIHMLCLIETSCSSWSSSSEVILSLRSIIWIIDRSLQIWEMLVHHECFVSFFSQQLLWSSLSSSWYHHERQSDLDMWSQSHETCISWCHIASRLFVIIQVSFTHVFDVQIMWTSRSEYHQCTQSQRHQENHEACHWYNAGRCWVHSSNQRASQVVQINLIMFKTQCIFHHLLVYEFD